MILASNGMISGKFLDITLYRDISGNETVTTEPPPKKLLDQVRDVLRVKSYSYTTEQIYVN
jgi:hypothetical protein